MARFVAGKREGMQDGNHQNAAPSRATPPNPERMPHSSGLLQSLSNLRNSFLTSRVDSKGAARIEDRSHRQSGTSFQEKIADKSTSHNFSISSRMPLFQFEKLDLQQNFAMRGNFPGVESQVEPTPLTLGLNAKSTRVTAFPPFDGQYSSPIALEKHQQNTVNMTKMDFSNNSTKRKSNDDVIEQLFTSRKKHSDDNKSTILKQPSKCHLNRFNSPILTESYPTFPVIQRNTGQNEKPENQEFQCDQANSKFIPTRCTNTTENQQPTDVSMALVGDQPGTVAVEASPDEVEAGAVLPSLDEQGKDEGGERKQPSDVSMALVGDQPETSSAVAGLDSYGPLSNDCLSASFSQEG